MTCISVVVAQRCAADPALRVHLLRESWQDNIATCIHFCWTDQRPTLSEIDDLSWQVNYLGPYHLTRLLEPTLIASKPSRVVNVSSIMHRSGHVNHDTEAFLSDWSHGSQYSNTKLANVLFTYEAQRRLGPHGVQVTQPLLMQPVSYISCCCSRHHATSHLWQCFCFLRCNCVIV